MEGAQEELERRSKFLSSLIQRKRIVDQQQKQGINNNNNNNVNNNSYNIRFRVRASDMPVFMQNKAYKCATNYLHSIPSTNGNENVKKIDSKCLALALKKEFDRLYGQTWQCIVGTSFGSYVTHSSGGFLYFSIDKVHVLLFKTMIDPMPN